jgi:hypothetical protein
VNAFFPRNIVANFLAAIRIGSESLDDFLKLKKVNKDQATIFSEDMGNGLTTGNKV